MALKVNPRAPGSHVVCTQGRRGVPYNQFRSQVYTTVYSYMEPLGKACRHKRSKQSCQSNGTRIDEKDTLQNDE